MAIWCDRVVTGGILFLVFFTPLAFGAVHPWAFSLMEGTVFLLVIVWMAKVATGPHTPSRSWVTGYSLPLLLFLIFGLFQLLPLPPSLLGWFSPSTHELYSKSLPGWPQRVPYADLSHISRLKPDASPDSRPALLPTPDEVRHGAPIPFSGSSPSAPVPDSSPPTGQSSRLTPSSWLPLSIAPSLTRTALFKFIAYASLFFLVLLYPFGRSGSQSEFRNPKLGGSQLSAEQRFFRSVLLMVLLSGLLVAVVGFIERFDWNGKILWFFVPYDWGAPQLGAAPRASGPFVNPDHFANYLSVIFPLALVGALFRTSTMPKDMEKPFRMICAFGAFVIFCGILLSLSRAGWTGVLLSGAILLWLFIRLPEERRPSLLSRHRMFTLRLSLAGLCLLVVLSLFFVGSEGRGQVDTRLEETVMHGSVLRGRSSVWQDSLGMVRDFPVFGVGLGAWPELFPRYERPPWSPDFYREAHNDYVQLLSEAGLVGFGLLLWFFWQCGKRIFFGVKRSPVKDFHLLAALLSAFGVLAFHELFDFSLQIPANAFLFTLFLALALRMAAPVISHRGLEISRTPPASRLPAFLPAAVGVIAFLLLVAVFDQGTGIAYPHNTKKPASLGEARELVLSYPARPSGHLSLLRLLADRAPRSRQLKELAAAVWLEPTNPYTRDLYAAVLIQQGRKEEGLKEMARSVFDSPSLGTHFYLRGRLLPWLSTAEQEAVEEGFKRSLRSGSVEALAGMAGFYAGLRRFSDEARLYEKGAARHPEPKMKSEYLLKAGLAYVRAGKGEKAERLFRQASSVTPRDLRPYSYLATLIYAPEGELESVTKVVSEGIKKGADAFSLYLAQAEAAKTAKDAAEVKTALGSARAVVLDASKKGTDPFPLYLSLARTAQRVGDTTVEKSALLSGVDLYPSSFSALFRLGVIYLQEHSFDRSAHYFGKAAHVDPRSANAFFYLAVAEEARYRFFAAEKAYARAVKLAPDNAGYKKRYEALKRKMEANAGKEASGRK
ncbi:MAG: O-antigen ligase family protein [Candidatus Binatia bacterium]